MPTNAVSSRSFIQGTLTNFKVCGNNFQNGGGRLPQADCNMPCAGNSGEICGGNRAMDVYQSTTTSSGHWTALGCYTDSISARAMSHYITVPSGQSATTIESCQAACLALGYTLAGVEAANECCKSSSFVYHLLTISNHHTALVCDNKIENGGPAPEGSAGCNMHCAGNAAETCGGNLRIDIFEYAGWTLLGCYTDSITARTLSDYVVVPGGQGATTIESCQAACKAAGYILAGLEYANECCKWFFFSLHRIASYTYRSPSRTTTNSTPPVCGNKIENGGDLASGCNMPCAGNSAETCGGNERMDLYQLAGSASIKSWHPLGCYTDNTAARTLSYYQSSAPAAMTVEICQELCLSKGYSYTGLEYAHQCCEFWPSLNFSFLCAR
jgi:hypothetical protein